MSGKEQGKMTPQHHEAFLKKLGISEEEHERWHEEHRAITPEEHKALMRKMGISEEDREWHERQRMAYESGCAGQVRLFAVLEAGFNSI